MQFIVFVPFEPCIVLSQCLQKCFLLDVADSVD